MLLYSKNGGGGFVKIYVKRMAYIKYFNFVFLVRVAGALGFGFICRRSECSDGLGRCFGAVFSGVADGAGLTA